MPVPLSESDAALLAFEERWPVHSGSKEEAIRGELGLSVVRYYLRLDRLIDGESALAHEPMLTGRLRRLRDGRRALRMQRVHRRGV